jgi:hypothetical protein
MGRREAPIDQDYAPLAAFARDLRDLRTRAGDLPYRALERHARYSASTLATAASGNRLPTLEVTLAYVRACSGDLEFWTQRWKRLYAALEKERAWLLAVPPSPGEDGSPARPSARPVAEPLGTVPDPTVANTPAEFIEQMKLLRVLAKNPSLHEMSRRVDALGRTGMRLPVSTLSDALRRQHQLPPWKLVLAFLHACGAAHACRHWEAQWARLAAAQQDLSYVPARQPEQTSLVGVVDAAESPKAAALPPARRRFRLGAFLAPAATRRNRRRRRARQQPLTPG